MNRWFFCWAMMGLLSTARAQHPRYPQGYFINPMNVPIELTANFGELRNNHWHMGLDIRTDARENLPVRAAAAGHIAAVGIRPLSFGRFIVIEHPNGLSTLYAHLNDFAPALEKYVTDQQYQRESWAVELQFDPRQFPVQQGQLIAFSGNTGGSAGPHLHFEIIDTKSGKRLNPLLFGFSLPDRVPPVIKSLALYDRGRSMSQQRPLVIPLKKIPGGYEPLSGPVVTTSLHQLSVAIQAFDQVSGSPNPNGIYSADLWMDEKEVSGFVIDSIDYDQTGYINAHIDYAYKHKGGPLYQHLSPLPGDASGVYKKGFGKGVIELNDTAAHAVQIKVADTYGNSSVVRFMLRATGIRQPVVAVPPVAGNTYFVPAHPLQLRRSDWELDFPAGGVYDSVPVFDARDAGPLLPPALTARYRISDPQFAVHKDFAIRLRAVRPLPLTLQQKVVMQRTAGAIKKVKPARYQQGWVTAEFDDFGYFQAYVDTLAPTVNLSGTGDTIDLSARSALVFTPADNFGVIKHFRAELNGEWLRFSNDKGRSWVYRFDERCPYGTHRLQVTVQDLVGNETTRSWWIKRAPYRPPVKKKIKKKKSKR